MFHYFGSDIKEQFYFQIEWINDIIHLEKFERDTVYCIITMTTSTANEYWQCKVSQKDISQFKLGNIPEDKQCLVINAAFRGQKSLYGQDLKWKVTRKGDGNCELALLFYFDEDFASRLGSLTICKVSDDQTSMLQQTWMKNSVQRYQDLFELSTALEMRTRDLDDLYQESKRNIKDIQARNAEAYFTNLSKFTELLNMKKLKIRALLGTEEEQRVTVESLQVKKREATDPLPEKKKIKRSTGNVSLSLSFPKQEHSDEESLQSSLLKQESFSITPIENEDNMDISSSDSEDDLFTQRINNSASQSQSQLTEKISLSSTKLSITSPVLTGFSENPTLSEHNSPIIPKSTSFDNLFFDMDDEDSLLVTKTT
ncbi:unnamed protein product [Rhizopus stolonifer]